MSNHPAYADSTYLADAIAHIADATATVATDQPTARWYARHAHIAAVAAWNRTHDASKRRTAAEIRDRALAIIHN